MTNQPSDFDFEPELAAGYVLRNLEPHEAAQFEPPHNHLAAEEMADLETTAAILQIVLASGSLEPVPTELARRLKQQALATLADDVRPIPLPTVDTSSSSQRGWPLRERLAWAACAASLLLAVSLWKQTAEPGTSAANKQPPSQALTQNQLRDRLLAAPERLQVAWTPGKTPFAQPVSGDVVWDNRSQQGFMRFVGMPTNDPNVEQYQLWIIDPARDDEPIDGGVFDIPRDGEVVIPIQAKLRVVSPRAFAITIEKPGGVVVSTQERLPLLAAVP